MKKQNFWREFHRRLDKTYWEKVPQSRDSLCFEDLDTVEYLEALSKEDRILGPVKEDRYVDLDGYSCSSIRRGILKGREFEKLTFDSKNERVDSLEERLRFAWNYEDVDFCIGFCSVVCRGLIVNALKERRVHEMFNLDISELVVEIELSIFKAIDLWVQKNNPEKHIFGFVQNFLYSSLEKYLKPIAGTHYQRKKYAVNSAKENPEWILGGYNRTVSYPGSFNNPGEENENKNQNSLKRSFDDRSDLESRQDLSSFSHSEFVKDIRDLIKKDEPALLKAFDTYFRIVAESKNERGIFINYALEMRSSTKGVDKNTLTKWGKYQIEKKLHPKILTIIKSNKMTQVFQGFF